MKEVKVVTEVSSATYVPGTNGTAVVTEIDATQATSAALYVNVTATAGSASGNEHFSLVPVELVSGAIANNPSADDGVQITASIATDFPYTLFASGLIPGAKYALVIDFNTFTSLTASFTIVLS